MKSTFAIIILFISNLAIGQIVYEKAVYSPDHPGDIELRDVILNIDSTDLINTGYYVHSQAVKYRDHGVLTSHHQSGNLQFAYDYAALDSLGKIMHMRFHSIVEDSLGGYIMVGTITKASNKHVSIPGDGDIAIVQVNSSGTVVESAHVDLSNGNDVAYSIIAKNSNHSRFIICGTSTLSSTDKDGFVMEINSTLDIQWVTNMDLRLSSGTGTLVELFDVAMDNDTIWSVGSIMENGSLNSEGLVVKLNGSGTYQTSRRVYNSTDREILYHVELDANDLIITGTSANVIFMTPWNRMIALKYNKFSHSVTNVIHLKTPNPAGGIFPNVGHDINKYTAGNGGYFVAGQTTPSTGSSLGVLYELNANFQPIHQETYSGSGNTALNALAIHNPSQEFIALNGLITNGTYKDGYVIKADFQGYSGCSDSVDIDSSALSLTTNTLLDDINPDYIYDTLYIARDTLIDSLICIDTVSTSAFWDPNDVRSIYDNPLHLYPNPVHHGDAIHVNIAEEGKILKALLVNSVGKTISVDVISKDRNSIEFNTMGLSNGFYLIRIIHEDRVGNTIEFKSKFIVE